MNSDRMKTVAARMTASSPGAIAVVGLAGPETRAILDRMTRRMTQSGTPNWTEGQPTPCRILDGDEALDDAVVCLMDDASGTRAEINTHGGLRIVQRVLMLLERLGAVIVAPDAFPDVLRSDDPIECSIDALLVRAESRRLVEWMLAQRSILPEFMKRLDLLDEPERRAFEARSNAAKRLVAGIQVALIGPPNAGKSTLANRLIGNDRVLTSDTPGTTRDWISETALIDGWPVTLTDTAGIRETACAIESEAIRRGHEQARSADLILLLVDGSLTEVEQRRELKLIRQAIPEELTVLVVHNKQDLGSEKAPPDFDGPVCSISAKTGDGIGELEAMICRLLGLDQLDVTMPTAFFDITRVAAA